MDWDWKQELFLSFACGSHCDSSLLYVLYYTLEMLVHPL
jgi:hypothetical protein